ncbi:unnamed protein product [Effrenium voratum]|uniref:Uncharacterized protein n=1 Tax=Effrenium voratum TaxID=2562239 RepID=A0AA36IVU4_9DINO|nr:unnamed protein product [Effrenium voratum]CAJ1447325.1 unnamed protein product [Effrenium voratum]
MQARCQRMSLHGLLGLWFLGCHASVQSAQSAQSAQPDSSVLVFRHCPRSTKPELQGRTYNNYSQQPFPDFPVAPMLCLPRGLDILQAQGRFLKASLPEPIHVVADDVERDKQTASALLEGLGLTSDVLTVSSAPFSKSDGCPDLPEAEALKALEEQVRRFPNPASYTNLTQRLWEVLGDGAAGDWPAWPCATKQLHLGGSCYVSSAIMERFLMEWAGGMPMAWSKLRPWELPSFLQLHVWARTAATAAQLVARDQASIAFWVLNALAEKGTQIFTGHDSQLNALQAIFELYYTPTPWPPQATLPASALRFDRTGSKVTITYHYVDFAEDSGAMIQVPVALENSFGQVEVSHLLRKALQNTVMECVNQPREVVQI